MAELLSKEPLFNGKTEFDQLDKVRVMLLFNGRYILAIIFVSFNFWCFVHNHSVVVALLISVIVLADFPDSWHTK